MRCLSLEGKAIPTPTTTSCMLNVSPRVRSALMILSLAHYHQDPRVLVTVTCLPLLKKQNILEVLMV